MEIASKQCPIPPSGLPLVFAEAVTASHAAVDGKFADPEHLPSVHFAHCEGMAAATSSASAPEPAESWRAAPAAALTELAPRAGPPGPTTVGDRVVVRHGLKLALSLGRERALRAGQVAVVTLVHSEDTVSLELERGSKAGSNLGCFDVASLELTTKYQSRASAGETLKTVGIIGAYAAGCAAALPFVALNDAVLQPALDCQLGVPRAVVGLVLTGARTVTVLAEVGAALASAASDATALRAAVVCAAADATTPLAVASSVARQDQALVALDGWLSRNWRDYTDSSLDQDQVKQFRHVERSCTKACVDHWAVAQLAMINESIRRSVYVCMYVPSPVPVLRRLVDVVDVADVADVTWRTW